MAEQSKEQQTLSKKEKLILGNPMELASVVRNQTLIIQNGLSLAGSGSDETHPLKVYSSFSRFVFALINADRKSVTANIRVTDIPGILAASEYSYKKHMDALYSSAVVPQQEQAQSPAFTKRFTSGNMKGKTPAQIILNAKDKEAAIEDLKKQYVWLRENAKKNKRYAEGNQEQMKAVEEAVNLFRKGELSEGAAEPSSASGTVIEIYNSGFRPLTRKEKKKGKTFIYEIRISWNIASAYPVTVEIKNYYAEVTEKENGTLNVQVKTKEAEQKNSMALSSAEWLNIIYMIRTNMEMFEGRSRDACYKAAVRAERKAREMAGLEPR